MITAFRSFALLLTGVAVGLASPSKILQADVQLAQADVEIVPTGLPVVVKIEKPLLVEETTSIYQRVLTRPGLSLFDAPNGKKVNNLWPLQPVYIYERQEDWIRVGRSERTADGWITEADTVPWVHNIVGAFTARGTNRPQQIIFEDEKAMQTLLEHESYLDLAARYRELAATGETDPDSGVLTIEKDEFVDITNSFYLMPITQFRERRIGSGRRKKDVLHLEVASIPLNSVTSSADDAEFRTGIVFVVDTTQSMKPFIPETLSAVRDIVGKLREKKQEDAVSFGLVGFRDDPEGRPGTEYRVREYVPLRADAPPEAILEGLSAMRAMEGASTWGYPEDSFAGLNYAIQNTVWQNGPADFAGRMIVLITDAPPKDPGDPHAESNRGPAMITGAAQEKGIGISTIFIESRSGRDYNEEAEEIYRTISRFRNIEDEMFYPVNAKDPKAFGDRVRSVVGKLVSDITRDTDLTEDLASEDDDVDMSEVGLAMRLAYLGRKTGQDVPAILRGWTLDRAIEQQKEFAIEPRVLVTRNQLLSMTEIMKGIIDEADKAAREGKENLFFENVRDVVVGLGGDGNRLANEGADNLGGMIGEFLEYLPYVSDRRIMSITETEWVNDPGVRINTTIELKDKLELYETLFNSRELWTPLYDGQKDGEHVYAMPLEALP
ncbi:vWA domain-containing protein [Pelagibius sp. Alg239-R121]|uniref:vWA domain-containing protein n=1 Tax=Pelagibius sp. Alg239-R121 TaxID=2993448 RepID=UPI0024A662E7|nr:vWA domain-containing protein [Pelagibius sp. Alg239-R121]